MVILLNGNLIAHFLSGGAIKTAYGFIHANLEFLIATSVKQNSLKYRISALIQLSRGFRGKWKF